MENKGKVKLLALRVAAEYRQLTDSEVDAVSGGLKSGGAGTTTYSGGDVGGDTDPDGGVHY